MSWRQWFSDRGLDELCLLSNEGFLERTWAPSEGDRDAAFALYTELRSRITTQVLNYQDGDEASALESVYRIFALTREIIHRHGRGCRHFAQFSLLVLNRQIRPFTARWHRKQVQGQLASQFNKHAFRTELQILQGELQRFVEALGWLAEGKDYCPAETPPTPPTAPSVTPTDHTTAQPDDSPPTMAGPQPPDAAHLLDLGQILTLESKDILARRARLECNAFATEGQENDTCFGADDRVGLAFSGGGIRSATFSLGVVQTLARRSILRDVDYLSTVSGGGYLGSFLSSYLSHITHPAHSPLTTQPPGGNESAALRHLRNHSKYLLGQQHYNLWQDLGGALLGIVQHLLCLLPVVLVPLLILAAVARQSWVQALVAVVLVVVLPALLLYLVFSPGARRLLDTSRELPPIWRSPPLLGLGMVVGAALLAILGLILSPTVLALTQSLLPLLLALPALPVLGALLALASQRQGIQKLAGVILGATAPLALLGLYVGLGTLLFHPGAASNWLGFGAGWLWLLLVVLGAAGMVLGAGININETGLHDYYRRHLERCYLLSPDPDGCPRPNRDPRLSALSPPDGIAPYHLINTTANFPGSKNLELRGRQGDFFVLSKYACGSALTGYIPTRTLEKRVPGLHLGVAMAVSGAALSPRMGSFTVAGAVSLLTLLNLRLGYWLPNPGAHQQNHPDTPNAWNLWRELRGNMAETDPLVNLSDGAHIENLALYELLRRRCRLIIAVDAESDPAIRCGSLLKLIRYASIDLGTTIEIQLDDLRPDEQGHSREHAALGLIHYDDGSRGHLLYIKPTLLGDEAPTLLDYRQRHPVFPHESTADQLFGEDQFEAYRALGERVADQLFRAQLLHPLVCRSLISADGRKLNAKLWLTALEASLLPMELGR